MKSLLLRWLRVTGRPDPPPGSEDSLTTFRASPRFFHYLGVQWVIKQIGALFGIVISFAVLGGLDVPFIRWDGVDRFLERLDEVEINLGMLFIELPLADLISLFEIFAAVGFLFQLVISGLLLRLSWEMRWYMVSNESLRIREGLVFVREQTMTVANIQNMSVRQGPIQKLFGIADLEVRTAGGGSSAESGESSGRSSNDFHIGRFRGLSDAHGLRDRLRATLAKHRDSGLGDPDEPTELLMPLEAGVGQSPGRLEAAAASLLDEARALRHVVEVSGS